MKTFACFILFVVVSLSMFAQNSTFIPGRPVGAGTFVTAEVYATGGPVKGFEMTITEVDIRPTWFNVQYIFSNNNWIYNQNMYNNVLKFVAVGTEMTFENTMLGQISCYVPESLSGNCMWPSVQFNDGDNNWMGVYQYANVIRIPFERYGDINSDGKLNIKDGIDMFSLIGTTPSDDTINVISDLVGNGGIITTWRVRLVLARLVDPNYSWPIFNNGYGHGSGMIETSPISMTWEKMPNGKWGLYSKELITNGDLVSKENSNISSLAENNFMFKKVDNKIYFVGQDGVNNSPILVADNPVELTGTVNNGRNVIISKTTSVSGREDTPVSFSLGQNYPNPFNPSTTISYQIPMDGLVTLKIYDILGKEVATLVNEQKSAGKYEVKFNASNITSGTYIYKISSGNSVQIKKMILMK